MAASPIPLFQEPRVKADNYANLNGHTYHYILGQPHNGSYRATVFLIHGWPDLSAGWRYQIPMLIDCNLRVVALDMMGYGETDAPRVPPHSIHLYGFKRAADDIEELARQLGSSKIILGDHDWGGAVVYRVAQYKPWLVTALFSVCTPYPQLTSTYRSTKDIVQLSAPQFAYQLHLASGEIEDTLKTRVQIRQFLNSIYGGKSPTGEVAFNPYKGFDFEVSAKAEKTRLVDDNVLDFYADQFTRNGLHGPCNWYRTREANFKDEQSLTRPATIQCPVLFILATKDNVLTRETAQGMDRQVPNLTHCEVDAGHWALWQAPEQVNNHVRDWVIEFISRSKSAL